jgi:uncharacterized protein
MPGMDHAPTIAPLRIALSGAGGLVGSALGKALAADGHSVVPISRHGGSGISWDGQDVFDGAALRACDAVIHLAGAGIADKRWSPARMHELRDSRIVGTTAIARLLEAEPGRVRTLIAASATGFYGERGEAMLDEACAVGNGFLAELCRDWEAAADHCRARLRVVHLRIGVVLSAEGGALARMLPSARFGMSGALGSGRQWWSWITRDDLVRAVQHALATPGLVGPVNAVAPQPVRQIEMAHAISAALGRPALAPRMPALALRLLLGRMADEVLCVSTRVDPLRLRETGFTWQAPDLRGALQRELAPST